MIDWVHTRLLDWAEHRARYESGGLGYPSRSPEARLMLEGAGAANHAPPGCRLPVTIPARVHRIESAVRLMPDEMRATVEVAYLLPGDRLQQAARLSRILRRPVPTTSFKGMINQAHAWLAGHLAQQPRRA